MECDKFQHIMLVHQC